mmetsp:Transcript_17879/g.18070  ORF Transcript_17879/g.18070 Transcript_17879/m.18070 type:complete len:157 (+) Transcript_17879:709-1179(+)
MIWANKKHFYLPVYYFRSMVVIQNESFIEVQRPVAAAVIGLLDPSSENISCSSSNSSSIVVSIIIPIERCFEGNNFDHVRDIGSFTNGDTLHALELVLGYCCKFRCVAVQVIRPGAGIAHEQFSTVKTDETDIGIIVIPVVLLVLGSSSSSFGGGG